MHNSSEEKNYWEMVTRQMSIVDKNQQTQFKNAKIAVIGCGGIGGGVIEILARMGVGELNIIDEDKFDLSNLNRQLMSSTKALGLSKAEVSKEQVKIINPYTKVNSFNEKLTEKNVNIILKDCDIVIDALDNLYTRIIVSRYARENNIPFIHGAIHGTLGQLTVFTKDTKSYEELFALPSLNKELNEETKEEIESLSNYIPPVIGPTPNIIGFLQAFEAYKIITNIGEVTYAPKIFKFDLLNLESFNMIEL